MQMLMNRIFALFAAVFAMAVAPTSVHACTCVGAPDVVSALPGADVVFIGRATTVRTDHRSDWTPLRYTFRVSEVWKGAVKREESIVTGEGGGDCGYLFELDREYLVVAYRVENGAYSTDICTRTAPVQEAAADLAFLHRELQPLPFAEDSPQPDSTAPSGPPLFAVGISVVAVTSLLLGYFLWRTFRGPSG